MARTPKPWFRADRNAYFVTIGGTRHNLGADKKDAERQFHLLMAEPEQPAAPPPKPLVPSDLTIAEVLEKYLEWCQIHRSARTYEWTQKHIQRFCDHHKHTTTTPAEELRPFHIIEWVDSKSTWGANQKRGAIVAVQRPFSWASKLGYIERNPVAGVEKPKPVRREQYVTPGQFDQLLIRYQEGDPFRDLLVFLWETGARPQEARHVEPRHFNAAFARFDIPPQEAKGKKRWRVIRMTEKASEIVKRRTLSCQAKIFENEDGNPWTADAVKCRFARLKKSKGLSHFAYGFRHGFATRKLTEGHDHLTVAELMGHASGQMLATVYSHLDQQDEHLKKALR